MTIKRIPFGTPKRFNVILEIPKGSSLKYEYDQELDAAKLKFIFRYGLQYIHNYGYICATHAGDGDHLDAFILGDYPLAIGAVIPCRAIGMIELVDRGEEDNKIIAVPIADTKLAKLQSITDIKKAHRRKFERFLKEMATQKKKIIKIKGFRDKDRAIKEIKMAHANFR